MSMHEDAPKTLAETIEEERLAAWREKRAKIAANSRQERLKIAEAERRQRLEIFEKEKAERIRQASEDRARAQAEAKAQRMALARSRIAGRTDIEVARNRLLSYRRREARRLALRLLLLVVLPTVGVAAYLSTQATPLYTSQVSFALEMPGPAAEPARASPFATSPLSRETHLVGEVLSAPQLRAALDAQTGFSDHYAEGALDPLTRRGLWGLLGAAPDPAQHFIDVSVNGQDGLIRIDAHARDPQTAQSFAQAVFGFAQNWTSDRYALRMVVPPSLPERAAYPDIPKSTGLAFLGFLAAFSVAGIFGRSLLRHGKH